MNAARHSHRPSWFFKAVVAGLLFLSGCGEKGNAVAQTVPAPSASPDYTTDIQPIFNRRCIACHGCLGSPCNVKLDSFHGADRGGFGVNPYSSHIDSSPRLGMDVVQTTGEWQQRVSIPSSTARELRRTVWIGRCSIRWWLPAISVTSRAFRARR
jgi:hypothetical protein